MSKYHGPRCAEVKETEYPGPKNAPSPAKETRYHGPRYAPSLRQRFTASKRALAGKYSSEIQGLLKIDPATVLTHLPEEQAVFEYDRLLEVVKHASQQNVEAKKLIRTIRLLGSNGKMLAHSTENLSKMLNGGLSNAVKR